MSGDHNQYQKGTSYLDLSKDGKEIELVVSHDFECPRCGHCCYVDADDTSQNHVDEIVKDEHEPVAWRTFDGEGSYDYRSYEMNETYDKEWAERNPNHKGWVEPLYTAPPKREWAGLTGDEARKFYEKYTDREELIHAIDKFLEEKNCGH